MASGHAKFNADLRDEKLLNVVAYAKITFKSTAFNLTQDALAAVNGDLTLLGVSRPVTLAVNNVGCTRHPRLKIEVCGADLLTAIRRSDFGSKYGNPRNRDVVTLCIQVKAFKDP